MLIWKKSHTEYSRSWTSPFILIEINGRTYWVLLLSGSTNFKSIVVKPYNKLETEGDDNKKGDNSILTLDEPYCTVC
jgi:hypothetical protein